jgi:hypothetical protein
MAHLGHLLMENRHGVIVNACVTAATGTAERDAAEMMLSRGRRHRTLGGDENYDVASFVRAVRALGITPHVAQKVKHTAIDARTARHAGYEISQRKRKLVEQAFGWMKPVGCCGNCGTAVGSWSIGSSPSRRRRTTSSDCGPCSPKRRDSPPSFRSGHRDEDHTII